jgi:uncharacterized Rossmann fold enzyme
VYILSILIDGKRYFLAREFGANKIRLAEFYFEDPDVNPIKKNKLKLEKKLMGIPDF